MGYEVDFIDVGEGEKSGDAICLRFGDLSGNRDEQFVMVIDGGTRDSGERLVKRIRQFYGTDHVDLVVSTHPDDDHVSGLRVVVEEMSVGRLWMHRPWQHSDDFKALFKNRTITSLGLKRSIRKALDTAVELEKLALERDIPIDEPFADSVLPFSELGLTVIGPTADYYTELLPQFRETPEATSSDTQSSFLRRAGSAVLEATTRVAENWGIETLTDPDEGATSAENNSSVILTIEHDDRRLLFTGDAGVPALDRSVDVAEDLGFHLPSSNFVQVPHHGSRRNVGPTVLDRLLGPKGQASCRSAFISCAKKSEKHPSKKVCNAFQRRGTKSRVHATNGNIKYHHYAVPDRGWSKADPLPFYSEVED